MNNSAYILLVVTAGAGVSLQLVMNSKLRQYAGSPMQAAVISLAIGLVVALLWCAVARYEWPTWESLRESPWWCWLGGFMGTLYLTSIVIVSPRLGVAVSLGLIIAGQVVTSTIIDHFGMLGAAVRPATVGRLAGVALTILGISLIAIFRD